MGHYTITEMDDVQMEGVSGGAPNAGQNLIGGLNSRLQGLSGKISVKMNISLVIIVNTVINAPLEINVNQGL